MFKKGANILYGTVGVCQIEGMSKTDFLGNDGLCYHLVPRSEKEITIYIPIGSGKVKVRGIITRQQAERFVAA